MAIDPTTLDLLTGRAMMDDAFRNNLTSASQATRRTTIQDFYTSIGITLTTAERDRLADNVSDAVVAFNVGGVWSGGAAT